jgi:glutamate 5-kinase
VALFKARHSLTGFRLSSTDILCTQRLLITNTSYLMNIIRSSFSSTCPSYTMISTTTTVFDRGSSNKRTDTSKTIAANNNNYIVDIVNENDTKATVSLLSSSSAWHVTTILNNLVDGSSKQCQKGSKDDNK